MAEEIFQSGILPSDSDFRIFRDYGQLPGLDMAQISNGYVYHTVFDNVQVIPLASLQSSGDNALSLVRGFANAYELSGSEVSHLVYFFFNLQKV